MQIIQFFNETINYIESVLDSEIDEDKIELETYRAREKQREVLDMLKENICYYIQHCQSILEVEG